MSNNADIRIGVSVDEKDIAAAAKDISNGVIKGVGNNGYIKLGAEITDYKYPKQRKTKSGLLQGHDYSQLQKAQDKLISDWNKLSKKGFSSRDEDLITVLKSFRDYQNEVTRHYGTNPRKDPRQKKPEDLTRPEKQAVNVITHIGNSLEKYFGRLFNEDPSTGTKGDLMSIVNNKEFEKYAARVIQRHKAATVAGVDLSKDKLTKSDMKRIDIAEIGVRRKAEQEKILAEREYKRKNAKKLAKQDKKDAKQVEKERAKLRKNTTKFEPGKVEDVQLSTTETKNLAEPTDYKQTRKDKRKDEQFVKELEGESYARKNNTPGYNMGLGVRSQVWNPMYVMEEFLRKMERGGTYADTNSLLRQTFQALPEEIKRANAELVRFIDKDAAIKAFTKLEDPDRKERDRIANETSMSKLLLTNVAKVQGALMAGKEGVTPQHLMDSISVALADAVEHGKSAIAYENYKKAVLSINNMLMNRYNNMKDRVGSNLARVKKVNGEEYVEDERGVGRNYQVVADTLTEVFADFEKNLKTLFDRAIKEFPDFYGQPVVEPKRKKRVTSFSDKYNQTLSRVRSEMSDGLKDTTAAIKKQTIYDINENSAERVADSKEGQANEKINTSINLDAGTGMNTDANASRLFAYLETIGKYLDELAASFNILASAFDPRKKVDGENGGGGKSPNIFLPNKLGDGDGSDSQQGVFAQIAHNLQSIDVNVGNILQKLINPEKRIPTNALTLVPGEGVKTHEAKKEPFSDVTDFETLHRRKLERDIENERDIFKANALAKYEKERLELEKKQALKLRVEQIARGERPSDVGTTTVTNSPKNIFDKIQQSMNKTLSSVTKVDEIMNMNQAEQEALLAQRRKMFGFANTTRNVADTGDVAQVSRAGFLWRRKNKNNAPDMNPFKDLKITPGIDIDYNGISNALQEMIEKNQFHAQTGGGFLKQVFGSATLYLGQDSIEKTRSQIDGLNEVFRVMRDAVEDLVASIRVEEMSLKGMEKRGEAVFDSEGGLTLDSSNEAFVTAARMEELKLGLRGVLAEVKMADDIVNSLGGNTKKVLNALGFASPELQKCNKIIRNINSGLDKGGKALKFQRRTQEVMNYAYQLMSRHIGQMVKALMMSLNPVRVISNLVTKIVQAIKSGFQDFASYDVKWQRTMNVVKYNFRTVIRPAMQWIAQSLTNIIGFFDIILMKIQAAFGQTPISLFDQSAADAEKMREETEQAANVAAGFDELHDISGEMAGGGDPAMDLMGDIYKPQLSEDWIKLAEEIGDIFASVIKGDMGFGEAMKKILDLAWEGIKKLWDWFKNTEFGKLWKIFLTWQLIKLGGKILYDALFGSIKNGGFTKWLSGLGTSLSGWFTKTIGGNSFGSGILAGLFSAANGMGLAPMLSTIFKNPEVVKEVGGWGKTLGMVFTQAFGAVLGGVTLAAGIDKNAKAGAYNAGLKAAGGNSEDEQSYLGGNIMGAVGGGLLGMFLVGGPLAIGIGAIAGLFATALAPAIQASAERARDLNNEMQSVEYYQGMVQGYTTEVNKWTEMEKLLSETLQLNTDKVINEGVALGHSKERMIELTNAVLDGKFTTDMLKDSEQNLIDMLTNLDAQQEKNRAATEKLEAAKRKLQKAEIDLAIAEDVAAGNFELAAARIEYAEAAMLYTEQEATDKRIQLYKEAGDKEAEYLLQDLTPEQREKMTKINDMTKRELASFVETWRNSSDEAKEALLDGIGPETRSEFEQEMNEYDRIIDEHVDGWQAVKDTLAEIFTFGFADTWTYNGEKKAVKVRQSGDGSYTVSSMAVGTNYVPNDGLVYLHQGEAVIPKKYNRPYEPQGMSPEERAYMEQMMGTMRSLDSTMKQGITVNGQFVQRGSDLVAVVNKTKSQTGADLLSNVSYAR